MDNPVPTALADLSIEDLETQLNNWGHKPSHAARLLRAFYASGEQLDPEALRLPRALSAKLQAELPPFSAKLAARAKVDWSPPVIATMGTLPRSNISIKPNSSSVSPLLLKRIAASPRPTMPRSPWRLSTG